ncbi:MAG TPA: cell division protein FtsB [Methyloradius sp.]
MRALTLIFVIMIAALQYPLWLGKGSWLRVWDLSRQITEQKDKNAVLKARNDTLDAEVRDLKQGYAAIEERARNELGMIKQDEVFYQIIERTSQNASQVHTPDSKVQSPVPVPDHKSATPSSKLP